MQKDVAICFFFWGGGVAIEPTDLSICEFIKRRLVHWHSKWYKGYGEVI